MHELAIAQSLAEVIAARATERQATRVIAVRLRIGEASGVVPEALSFCFEMVASLDPLLAGARLDIERTPHLARCRPCDRDFAVRDFVAECPACGAWSDQIISGGELQALEMEFETSETGKAGKTRETGEAQQEAV